MKKRAGRLWAWLDSWPKIILAWGGALSILSGTVYQVDGRYAKALVVAGIQVQLSEDSLLKVQDRIFELDQAKERRPLTPIEERRLRDLKEQERQVLEKLRRQQGK